MIQLGGGSLSLKDIPFFPSFVTEHFAPLWVSTMRFCLATGWKATALIYHFWNCYQHFFLFNGLLLLLLFILIIFSQFRKTKAVKEWV